ncbi:unnamed protein product [Mucor circinelloides]
MSDTVEIEDMIQNVLQDEVPAEGVQDILKNCLEMQVSPNICLTLVAPLFKHAIRHDTSNLDIYVDMIVDLYVYLNNCAMVDDNVIFRQVADLFLESLFLYMNEGNTKTLLNIPLSRLQVMRTINLASMACLELLRLFNGSESESSADTLWQRIPSLLDFFAGEVDQKNINLITNLASMAQCLICQKILTPSADEITSTLISMVSVALYCFKFQENVSIVGSCISAVVATVPEIELSYTCQLSDLTNSLADSLASQSNHSLCKAMFNVSFLLARNHAAVPWINDFDIHQYDDPEIELLKENIAFVEAIPSDQADFTHVQDMSEAYEDHYTKAVDIITDLVSMEGSSEDCYTLLNNLEYIATHSDARPVDSICMPYMKQITECTTQLLLKDPELATAITSLLGYSLSNFLKKYLHFALPYAVIYTQDEDALDSLANVFEQAPIDLVRQEANHVIIALLLEQDAATKEAGEERLVKLFRDRDILEQLVHDNHTSLTATIVMHLAHPTKGEYYYQALTNIKNSIYGDQYHLSDFLSELMLAITEKVFYHISEIKCGSLEVPYPFAFGSLEKLMSLLDENINLHNRHLMKVFNSVVEIPDMQSQAFSLWKTYLDLLNQEAVVLHINAIVQGLCNIILVSSSSIRVQVAAKLDDLLVHNASLLNESFANFPVLPDFVELDHVKKFVAEHHKSIYKMEIRNIIKGFTCFDGGLVLSNLQKLQDILVRHPNERFRADELYAYLFDVIRKYSTHELITYYAARCLGLLGAADPSAVNMRTIDNTVFVMRNFNNDDENLTYIYDLIINHIFPSYNSISNGATRQSIEYAIQILLHIAGYRPIKEMKSNASLRRVFNCWRKHPKDVQEFLAPFLQSAYQGKWPDIRVEYPIFSRSQTFKEWVHKWYCCMANDARGNAGRIFKACLPMVQSGMTDIALHLLPYLVLHSVFSSKSEHVCAIIDELQFVLDINARPADDPEKLVMNRYALQLAVAITQYCRKWLHHVGRNDLTFSSVVERVNQFLKRIPDQDMGFAAFNAGAYPQALMHFETHIKEHSSNQIKDREIMKCLRRIYLELDQISDYKALMDSYIVNTNRDEQIAQHVNLGEWDYAETLYKSKISDRPLDLSAYTGYLECLSKSNRFNSLLYEVDNKLTESIPWQPQINSYRIDAAWHVEDWSALEKAVNKPMERNMRALVGCALHQMKNNLPIELTFTIDEARSNIVKQIAMSVSESYRKCYPQLFELQLLEELEASQQVWNKPDPVNEIKAIQPLWHGTLERVIPRSQYRLNLLELRKAAFYDIRDSEMTKAIEAELWMDLYRENRKLGNMVASLTALNHAEQLSGHDLHYEMAKWYWKKGLPHEAQKLLAYHNQKNRWDPYDALLMTDIHLDGPEIVDSPSIKTVFHSALKIDSPKLEKANFNCLNYYLARFPRPETPAEKLRLQEIVVQLTIQALEAGSKYYYSTISRLFNTYFEVEKQMKEASRQPSSETNKKILLSAKKIDATMVKMADTIRPFQFILFLTRLMSHLSTDNHRFAACLQKIVKNCFAAHPRNTIWLLLGAVDSEAPFVAKRMQDVFNLAKAQCPNNTISEIILQANAVREAFFEVLNAPFDADVVDLNDRGYSNPFAKLHDLDLYMPNEASMVPTLPGVIKKNDLSIKPFPSNLPTIKGFDSKVTTMKSLQKPKRIKIWGSDGEVYSFLLKKEDDLRNDARTMEFFYMINHFLRKNTESRDGDLYIRTFAILPMGKRWGVIEWIDNLASLKSIVNDYWEAIGNPTVPQIAQKMSAQKLGLGAEKTKHFEKHILPMAPPQFYKWFLRNFPEPGQWLASRTRYIKTLAVMSFVGHIVGLGDRHADNMMFDVTNGDVVHVDLNLVFGRGSTLPVPELVPFRLTHNLVHAMGILGTKGLFHASCVSTMSVLLKNKDSLLSVFQTLLNELEVAETANHKLSLRSSQKNSEKIIETLKEKFSTKQSEVNKEVDELIKQATDNSRLAQMFPGWAPFI